MLVEASQAEFGSGSDHDRRVLRQVALTSTPADAIDLRVLRSGGGEARYLELREVRNQPTADVIRLAVRLRRDHGAPAAVPNEGGTVDDEPRFPGAWRRLRDHKRLLGRERGE